MSPKTGFGKIRAYLWPIHRDELKKFIPILLIFFLVGFNYSLLRATKDALVVTAPSSGAEALPFLKVWAIVPCAFLFTFIFTRVSNRLSREKVFYVMMSMFYRLFHPLHIRPLSLSKSITSTRLLRSHPTHASLGMPRLRRAFPQLDIHALLCHVRDVEHHHYDRSRLGFC